MSGTTTKLTAAAEEYFADLRRVRASGAATPERSLYGPLGDLLKAVGATLKPKVFCVQEPADQGAGHPDFGLYAANQVQRGTPHQGQTPERGVVEVKPPAGDAWLTAEGRQASRYWGRYRLVLVTNARDFVLIGEDAQGRAATLEALRLAAGEDEFLSRLEKPHAFARDAGARLGEYLSRALSHRAALTEPKDLAWLLASYARDGLARVEAAGGVPQLAAVRSALEDALGIRFEGDRGRRFFRSTLVQTLFYGIFSAWVLWARTAAATPEPGRLFANVPDAARFRWREAVLDDAVGCLGRSTFDIYLNENAFWRNVPAAVWTYRLGGYRVLKKWLSYRERGVLDRALTPQEVQRFADTARRLAAILTATRDHPANKDAVP